MSREIHLVVLVHGLWGTIHHFDYIAGELASKKGASIHDSPDHPLSLPSSSSSHIVVYRTHSNEGYFTYDGVDVCGVRVANELQQELEALDSIDPDNWKVAKISIVGYSLGGLISRYAIGLLYRRGIFDTVKPVTFTTFCTPHVGVVVLGNRFTARAFNFVGQYAMSSTSKQLFLADTFQFTKMPLLQYMSDHESPFYIGLSLFRFHTLYANIINDHRCEYYTSAIDSKDPFTGHVSSLIGPYVEGYGPTVIDLSNNDETESSSYSCLQFKDKNGVENVALNGLPSKQSKKYSSIGYEIISKVQNWGLRVFQYTFLAIKVLIIVPVWFIAFLTNAAYQSVVSSSRQRPFRKSGEHISLLFDQDSATAEAYEPGRTMDDILEDRAENVVETMYQTFSKPEEALLINKNKRHLLLSNDGGSNSSSTNNSNSSSTTNLLTKAKTTNSKRSHGSGELALLDVHQSIVRNLNELKWNKFPVHITLAKHTHAAVIVRFPSDKFVEGKTIIDHWIQTSEWVM